MERRHKMAEEAGVVEKVTPFGEPGTQLRDAKAHKSAAANATTVATPVEGQNGGGRSSYETTSGSISED